MSNPSYGQIVRRAHQLDEKIDEIFGTSRRRFPEVKISGCGKKRTSVLQNVIKMSRTIAYLARGGPFFSRLQWTSLGVIDPASSSTVAFSPERNRVPLTEKILSVTWTWFRPLARRSRARDWSQLHRIYAVGSGWSEGRFAHARVARIARGIFSHRALKELMTSDLAHSLKRNEVFTASCSLRKTTALPDLDFTYKSAIATGVA